MEHTKDSFEISIKDDFFDTDRFTQIYNEVPYQRYTANAKVSTLPHVCFLAPVPPALTEYIKERCEEMFNKKLNITFSSLLLSKPDEPRYHRDYDENCSHQILIYIRGKQELHKGTGFYVRNGDDYELNTHIGFRENRAIFWDARAYHSPLTFAADDKNKRFSMKVHFKEIK